MRTNEQEEEFLEILRAKINAISSRTNNVFPGYGYITIGEGIQAYKEAVTDYTEQQAKEKQPRRPRIGAFDDESFLTNHY